MTLWGFVPGQQRVSSVTVETKGEWFVYRSGDRMLMGMNHRIATSRLRHLHETRDAAVAALLADLRARVQGLLASIEQLEAQQEEGVPT